MSSYKDEGILWQGRNPAGYTFTVYGNAERMAQWIAHLNVSITDTERDIENEDYDERSLNYADKTTDGGRFTQAERDENLKELNDIYADIQANGWMPQFLKMPRKKNGSLAINRVVTLWRGETFQRYWEDSYGFNAPELSLKSLGDYDVRLELTDRTVGY